MYAFLELRIEDATLFKYLQTACESKFKKYGFEDVIFEGDQEYLKVTHNPALRSKEVSTKFKFEVWVIDDLEELFELPDAFSFI